jgi:putative peptidoglycan lipid II flippase
MTLETSDPAPQSASQPTRSLLRSASLLSLGNIASRVLGLVREIVITNYFGASGQISAFRVASQVPTMLYDFLIGGMLSAALVPILSDYARRSRTEFTQLAGVLIALFTIGLTLIVLGLELLSPTFAWVLAGGFAQTQPELLPLTSWLIRLLAPAVWLFGMAGLLTAMLYAQQRFTVSALATAIFNLGIVIATPLLAPHLGVLSLVVGILAGSLAQLLLMGWDLHRAGFRLRLHLEWRHPALRKLMLLYAPIAAGLLISLFQIGLDRRLATGATAQSVAWMATATTLQQMPLGLISVAIALAALPRLSQYYAAQDEASYRQTLGRGLRMIVLLIAPAAVGLWLLGEPLTRLLFEHGKFTPQDTTEVVRALAIYTVGMVFAAIDFPLNYAFYARNNTVLPALVGVFSVVVYVLVAFSLLNPLGYLGLVWADTAKQASHACVMIGLLYWRVGRLGAQIGQGMLRILLSAGVMALVIELTTPFVAAQTPATRWGALVLIAVSGGIGLVSYLLTAQGLKLDEIRQWRRLR